MTFQRTLGVDTQMHRGKFTQNSFCSSREPHGDFMDGGGFGVQASVSASGRGTLLTLVSCRKPCIMSSEMNHADRG